MEQITALFKALSDKNRLRVVAALLDYEELCACEITELLQVTGATASRHMGVLMTAKLVSRRKDGRWVNYRLTIETAEIVTLLGWIETRLANDMEANADQARMKEIIALGREEICRKQRGEVCCPV